MAYDDFSVRMKAYEAFETERRLLPLLPVYARIDGRGFHSFTKGMDRPYDVRLHTVMVETTKYLVDHTHAKIGYSQSDEISLVWCPDRNSSIIFDGRVQKMTSVLAGMATAAFTKFLLKTDLASYADKMPHFDCRVIVFPSKEEAANMFLWRNMDATKNAISMAARHYYSHKALQGKSGTEMQEMLFQKGVNFNDYPVSFKRGTFVHRVVEMKTLSMNSISKIKAAGKFIDPNTKFARSSVKEIDMPIFSKVVNRANVIFDGDSPLINQSSSDKNEQP